GVRAAGAGLPRPVSGAEPGRCGGSFEPLRRPAARRACPGVLLYDSPMPLTPSTRLGHYEIVAPLGAGGMGEGYRARDTRLGREVAVKVLPQHLSANSDLRARFEREARTVSALNHPHICVLHDVGRENGTDFLVMELVDGESLADRLARAPLSPA